ncbi:MULTISPECIES: Acg family FMN-binding oxidoreductase [unclassified Nocardioides]|uniref:Acg family FMN-binding oxidoreductase n=1 Tax=unclassified Nocardioides TaxID=2615069 RepID=UPI0009F04570|nr:MULTISPECIES: nitroreductase family protein [unclassified Nocardioides]GAW50887.1 uncharacterized protein PD653B2_3223 [Nocardioides sp. PD653-B2]GAW54045.1 uncharacterized protein PD653_1452 [Nocardioides sp. PD653]
MSARPGPATLRRIVELACRAPSVHNTQPWLWRVTGSRLDLYADPTRQLVVADRDGRNLTISCGAALHHAQVAAGALGLQAYVRRLPVAGNPRHLASLELTPRRRSSHAEAELRALERRSTDRRRFTAWPMTEERLTALAGSASTWAVHVTPVTDVATRVRLELLVSRAMALQDADPRLTAEQQRWIDHSPVDGIPSSAVRSGCGRRLRASRFDHPVPAEPEEPMQSTDGVLLLSTDADDPAAWLRTGEALSALWLRATTEGLSVVPLSQVVEVAETRSVLHHDLLGGRVVPQALLRIGWQEIGRSEFPRTPRRPVDDVILR